MNKKVKGSALTYVIIIALILMLTVMLFQLKNLLDIKQVNRLSLQILWYNQLESGINYKMNNENASILELNNLPGGTVKLTEKPWGAYSIMTASIKGFSDHFTVSALVGQQAFSDTSKRKAIYIVDDNDHVYISGNCNMKGEVYISDIGFEKTYMGGTGYRGNALSQITQKKSNNKLPLTNSWDIESTIGNSKTILYEEILDSLSISASFKPTECLHIYSEDPIIINSQNLSGNIVIQSEQQITLDRNCVIQDAILIAPYIHISSCHNSNFQCFAKDSIIIEDGCTLHFPSSLIVQDGSNPQKIKIGEACNIHGDIIAKGKLSNLIIGESATVFGRTYAKNKTELIGDIYGSCYTYELTRKINGTTYTNSLYNNTINPYLLSNMYAGCLLFQNHQKKLIKWLY